SCTVTGCRPARRDPFVPTAARSRRLPAEDETTMRTEHRGFPSAPFAATARPFARSPDLQRSPCAPGQRLHGRLRVRRRRPGRLPRRGGARWSGGWRGGDSRQGLLAAGGAEFVSLPLRVRGGVARRARGRGGGPP